ncbi:hypothetical protein [Desulfobacca acetoxidans]
MPLSTSISNPAEVRRRFDTLRWQQRAVQERLADHQRHIQVCEEFLALEPRLAARLDQLSQDLFGDILDEVERNLTYALKEILEQDLRVITAREVKKGKISITFAMERQGDREDILTGQGGSVCNIMSVGLRLIALSQLPEHEHRRFLILDEQDCWLRPDLVPRLMHIIHTIAAKLNFQILVISHHDLNLVREYADRIYRLTPPRRDDEGPRLELVESAG